MNARATAVAGDWGTSHLRLFLCRGREILDTAHGPGIASLSADASTSGSEFLTVLSELTARWVRDYGAMSVWLAGMIGSRNGWRETPYVGCPADAAAVSQAVVRFTADGREIAIPPGLRCVNPNGAPDVMRGEETQVIGALALEPGLAMGPSLLGLPGTHTKWVLVDGDRIVTFQTSLSGELYALLSGQSTLVRVSSAIEAGRESGRDAFESGLARCRELDRTPLTHLLFEVRSRQLLAGMSRSAALAFLSGLIIGQDVAGALASFSSELKATPAVTLVGAADLVELYRRALAARGVAVHTIDAAAATVAGLQHLMSSAERSTSSRALAT